MESTPTVLLVPTSVVPRPGAPWRAMNQCQAVPPSALTVVTVLLRAARKQRLCSVPAHSRIQLHPCAFAKSQLKNQFNWQWRVPVINMGRPGLCRRIFVVVVFQSYSLSGRILGLRPANERRRYKVTPPLTGWAQTWNQPWFICHTHAYI